MKRITSPPPRRDAGFSMVEILLVLVVMGILSGLVAPAMSSYLAKQNARAAIVRLKGDILYARMLAIQSGANATFTPTATGYVIQAPDPSGNAMVARSVDLASEHHGMTVAADAAVTQFDARGMVTGGGGQVSITRAGETRSLFINVIGTVTCDDC